MSKIDKDVAAMLKAFKKYDNLVESTSAQSMLKAERKRLTETEASEDRNPWLDLADKKSWGSKSDNKKYGSVFDQDKEDEGDEDLQMDESESFDNDPVADLMHRYLNGGISLEDFKDQLEQLSGDDDFGADDVGTDDHFSNMDDHESADEFAEGMDKSEQVDPVIKEWIERFAKTGK